MSRNGETTFLTDAFRAQGRRFTLLSFANGNAIELADDVGHISIGGAGGLADAQGLVRQRYDAEPGTSYLLRPDGYVAARFRHPTREAIATALARASGCN